MNRLGDPTALQAPRYACWQTWLECSSLSLFLSQGRRPHYSRQKRGVTVDTCWLMQCFNMYLFDDSAPIDSERSSMPLHQQQLSQVAAALREEEDALPLIPAVGERCLGDDSE